MPATIALTRPISARFAHCELTHLERQPIDLDRARAQHAAYERLLAALGCHVERLPAADDLPDAVFVEDTAVVIDEVAIMTRPGAPSRRGECAAVEQALRHHRRCVHRIEAPATLDGGDVLRVGRRLFVGRSGRSSDDGIEQLGILMSEYGYAVSAVDFRDCLHLKSAVTCVGENRLLFNPAWVDADAFRDFERIEVDPREPFAGNALWPGKADVILPSAFPATAERLAKAGLTVHPLDVSEIARAEGGVTCCSILLDGQ